MAMVSVCGQLLVFVAVVLAGTEAQNGTSTTAAACMNTIPDCHYHRKEEICEGIYKPWASARCALYCGFCTPPEGYKEQCEDTIPNCVQYQPCNDPSYFVWVEDHCRKFCHHCGPTTDGQSTKPQMTQVPQTTPKLTTSLPSGSKPTGTAATVSTEAKTTAQVSPTCMDKFAFCSGYSKSACNNMAWATSYCPRFCNVCDAVTTKPTTTTKQETGTTGASGVTSASPAKVSTSADPKTTTAGPPDSCRDKLASCYFYSRAACQNEQWARTYCARFCNNCA